MRTIQLEPWEILAQEIALLDIITHDIHAIQGYRTNYMWCTLHGNFFAIHRYGSCPCDTFEYTVSLSDSEIVALLRQEIETGVREVHTHKV